MKNSKFYLCFFVLYLLLSIYTAVKVISNNKDYDFNRKPGNLKINTFRNFRFKTETESKIEKYLSIKSSEIEKTMTPITSGWLSLTTDLFDKNDKFPNLYTFQAIRKIKLDNNKLINEVFTPNKETSKENLNKFHFYARVNEKYLYFTPLLQESTIIFILPLSNIFEVKSSYSDNNCFIIKANGLKQKDTMFKICSNKNETSDDFYCIIQSIINKKDYSKCFEKKINDKSKNPLIIKRKIVFPKLIIPEPIKKCNLNWNYDKNGEDWECICKNGKEQSPIDLPLINKAITAPVKPIFDYYTVNNDKNHLISNNNLYLSVKALDKENGFGRLINHDGFIFIAEEIIFHSPSEHTINGKTFPLEISVLHTSSFDKVNKTVVNFLFTGKPGIYNKFLEEVEFFNLPNTYLKETKIQNKFSIFDILYSINDTNINKIKPFSFYTYQGSLTKPPCTEKVTHYVLSNPIEASVSSLDMFKEALRNPDLDFENQEIFFNPNQIDNHSNRSTQELNSRLIFHYNSDIFEPPQYNEVEDLKKNEHYEKQILIKDNYIFIEGNKSSGIKGAIIVSNDEIIK